MNTPKEVCHHVRTRQQTEQPLLRIDHREDQKHDLRRHTQAGRLPTAGDHEAILEQVIAKNAVRAKEMMINHIMNSRMEDFPFLAELSEMEIHTL